MDFKTYQFIRGQEGTQVRPKNIYTPVFNQEWRPFETFANQHTYTVANPQDIPEDVTEVRREDVEIKVQYKNEGGSWAKSAMKEDSLRELELETRQAAYYSPKQEREEEAAGDWYCPKCEMYLCGEQVTYEEIHGNCGTEVEFKKHDEQQHEKPKEENHIGEVTEMVKDEELTNYFLFREIQSKSFQYRNEFIEWLNKNYTITKK